MPKYRPTCIALLQLRGLLRDSCFLFKKPSCSRQMLAAEKILEVGFAEEGAVAGRICVGCAGFRTDSGWKCRFRGAGLARASPLPAAGPRDAETWSPPPPDCSRRPRLFSEALPQRNHGFFPLVSTHPFSDTLSFLHVDLDFQNSNQQSVENNLQLRSSTADPLSIKSICKALPSPLPEVAAIGLKKKKKLLKEILNLNRRKKCYCSCAPRVSSIAQVPRFGKLHFPQRFQTVPSGQEKRWGPTRGWRRGRYSS